MTHDGVRRRAAVLYSSAARSKQQHVCCLLPVGSPFYFLMAQAAADRVRAPVSEDRKERVPGRMVARARALKMVLQCDGGGITSVWHLDNAARELGARRHRHA